MDGNSKNIKFWFPACYDKITHVERDKTRFIRNQGDIANSPDSVLCQQYSNEPSSLWPDFYKTFCAPLYFTYSSAWTISYGCTIVVSVKQSLGNS